MRGPCPTAAPVRCVLRARRKNAVFGVLGGIAGYATGVSSAAAAGPQLVASATEGDLPAMLQAFAAGAAALSHGAGQGVSRLGVIGARLGDGFSFALGGAHADPAACASIQGIGFAVLGVAALLIVALARMRICAEHRRLDVARRLIERGLPVPDGLVVAPARRDLRRGVVLVCSGIGVCIAGLLLADRGLGATGLVPAFIGVGYLVAYRLAVGEALVPEPVRGPLGPAPPADGADTADGWVARGEPGWNPTTQPRPAWIRDEAWSDVDHRGLPRPPSREDGAR